LRNSEVIPVSNREPYIHNKSNGSAIQVQLNPSVEMTIQTALRGGSTVEISVSDSGPGIPELKLGEIFDTFYTTKEHGTGLGLSIAQTVVETYGGKIWAENRPGGGAVFRFTLPLILRPTVLEATS
jgi:signal transduction histidine kinase